MDFSFKCPTSLYNQPMKKILSAIIACLLVFSVSPIHVFAANNTSVYEYNQDEVQITVEYTLSDSSVTEKIIISEENAPTSIVEKVINPDGMLAIYLNDSLQGTIHSDCYEQFLKIAEGDMQSIQTTATRAYGCGISAAHTYVRSYTETTDLAAQGFVVSSIVTLLTINLSFPVGAIVGVLTSFVQYACNEGVDYIDLTQTQYYVHDGYPNQDLECYHVYFESYNRTSSGGRDVFSSGWDYYQYFI